MGFFRLDEYQKMISKQLEYARKMEDPESTKQLAVINKYESMLREQQEVWTQYEVWKIKIFIICRDILHFLQHSYALFNNPNNFFNTVRLKTLIHQ